MCHAAHCGQGPALHILTAACRREPAQQRGQVNEKRGVRWCSISSKLWRGNPVCWLSLQMMELLSSREWGLLVLDEVHVAPANEFRTVSLKVKACALLKLVPLGVVKSCGRGVVTPG